MLKKFAHVNVIDIFDTPKIMSSKTASKIANNKFDMEFKPLPNKLYAAVRSISNIVNDNMDGFPAAELRGEHDPTILGKTGAKYSAGNEKYGYRTFVAKPNYVDHVNHDKRNARGIIVASHLHEDPLTDKNRIYLAKKPDPIQAADNNDSWVSLLIEMDKNAYPNTVTAVKSGKLDVVSMGTDIEYSVCSVCGNVAQTESEYCQHISQKGQLFRTASGPVVAYESNHGLGFFEISWITTEQADPTAHKMYHFETNPIGKASSLWLPKKTETTEQWENRRHALAKIAYRIGDKKEAGDTNDWSDVTKTEETTPNNEIDCPLVNMELPKEACENCRLLILCDPADRSDNAETDGNGDEVAKDVFPAPEENTRGGVIVPNKESRKALAGKLFANITPRDVDIRKAGVMNVLYKEATPSIELTKTAGINPNNHTISYKKVARIVVSSFPKMSRVEFSQLLTNLTTYAPAIKEAGGFGKLRKTLADFYFPIEDGAQATNPSEELSEEAKCKKDKDDKDDKTAAETGGPDAINLTEEKSPQPDFIDDIQQEYTVQEYKGPSAIPSTNQDTQTTQSSRTEMFQAMRLAQLRVKHIDAFASRPVEDVAAEIMNSMSSSKVAAQIEVLSELKTSNGGEIPARVAKVRRIAAINTTQPTEHSSQPSWHGLII
jgi:hypothetical protein